MYLSYFIAKPKTRLGLSSVAIHSTHLAGDGSLKKSTKSFVVLKKLFKSILEKFHFKTSIIFTSFRGIASKKLKIAKKFFCYEV